MNILFALGEKRKITINEFHSQMPVIAYRMLLAVDPTTIELSNSSFWNLAEDLLCLVGKQWLPEGYHPLTRTLSAWKYRYNVIRDTMQPAHLFEMQQHILMQRRLSRLRYVYSQDKCCVITEDQLVQSAAESVASSHDVVNSEDTEQTKARRLNLKNIEPKEPSRQTLVLKLLKYVALFEYRSCSDNYISVYDYVLALALHEHINVDFLVEDYKVPQGLVKFNFSYNLSDVQIKEFLGLLIDKYPEVHPSDIDYLIGKQG